MQKVKGIDKAYIDQESEHLVVETKGEFSTRRLIESLKARGYTVEGPIAE